MSRENQCPSVHRFSGEQCIQAEGHEGVCCGKAERFVSKDGVCITRAEWHSVNGKYRSHHQYVTTYPANATRRDSHAN